MSKTFERLIEEHGIWADATFPKGTDVGAMLHAERECAEVLSDLRNGVGRDTIAKEYADVIFCVMDSARRRGIPLSLIIEAGDYKLQINKCRTWKDNGDGSYSHIK